MKEQFTYDLDCRFDSHKSFGGKARVVQQDEGLCLYSYNTLVACIPTEQDPEVYNTQSPTTLRHVKEFLKQHGWKAETSKQIDADYWVDKH